MTPRKNHQHPPLLNVKDRLHDLVENVSDALNYASEQLPHALSPFDPQVDICDTGTELHIFAELPGMSPEEVEVITGDRSITIRGEKKDHREGYEFCQFSERHFGKFHRSFGLPKGMELDKIEADFEEGVLKLVIPKSTESKNQTRKIKIRKVKK